MLYFPVKGFFVFRFFFMQYTDGTGYYYAVNSIPLFPQKKGDFVIIIVSFCPLISLLYFFFNQKTICFNSKF